MTKATPPKTLRSSKSAPIPRKSRSRSRPARMEASTEVNDTGFGERTARAAKRKRREPEYVHPEKTETPVMPPSKSVKKRRRGGRKTVTKVPQSQQDDGHSVDVNDEGSTSHDATTPPLETPKTKLKSPIQNPRSPATNRPYQGSESMGDDNTPSSTPTSPPIRAKRVRLIVREPTTCPDKQWPPTPSHPTPPPRPGHPQGQGPQPHNNAGSPQSSCSSLTETETPLQTPDSQSVDLPHQTGGKGKMWYPSFATALGGEAGRCADDVEGLCDLCKGWSKFLREGRGVYRGVGSGSRSGDDESVRSPSSRSSTLILEMSDECECRRRQAHKSDSDGSDVVNSSNSSPINSPVLLPAPPTTPVTPLYPPCATPRSSFALSSTSPGTSASTRSSPLIASPPPLMRSEQSCGCPADEECCGLQYLPLEVWDPFGELGAGAGVTSEIRQESHVGNSHNDIKMKSGEEGWKYESIRGLGLGLCVGESLIGMAG